MKLKHILSISLIGIFSSCAPHATQRFGLTTPVENKTINWEAFDNSSFQKNEIKVEQLQGEWSAYQGIYQFGKYQNAMNLDKPFIIEVKGQAFRRAKGATFEDFQLVDNWLVSKTISQADTGIINQLTDRELTISWKSGPNYTRYYYKKLQ